MSAYRTIGVSVFSKRLKFGIADRIDQFVEWTKQADLDQATMSSEDWVKLYAKWTKSNQELQEYLKNIL